MKKFATKLILFLIPTALLFYIKPLYLLQNDRYKQSVVGSDIYGAIEKSKQRSDRKTLLLGDSVARQLFSKKDDQTNICSLACNQAIGVPGQYFLLNNSLAAGSRPDEVVLVYTPFSFQNNLDTIHTYSYFLKPFFNSEYSPLFTETVRTQIKKIPFSALCREPSILTSGWAPDFTPGNRDYTFMAPLSREYVEKMKNLCTERGIKFYIVPTPVKESFKTMIQEFDRAEIRGLAAERELVSYLDHIQYIADSRFIDRVHLKAPDQLWEAFLLNMKNIQEELFPSIQRTEKQL